MPPNMRPLMRVARLQQQSAGTLSRNPLVQRAFASSSKGSGNLPAGTPGESSEQAMPIGPYYEAILIEPQPIPKSKPEVPPTSSPKAPQSSSSSSSSETASKPPQNQNNGNGNGNGSQKKKSSPGNGGGPPPHKSKGNRNGGPGKSSSQQPSGTITTSSTSTSTSTPFPTVNTNANSAASATAIASAAAILTPTSPPQPSPSSEPTTAEDKARIIFSSRLAGPLERADRLQSIRERSAVIAGVLVPPRPEEPDNCCMSGCVNCVWDRYRDELEDWAAAEALVARRRSQAQVGSSSSEKGRRGDVAPVSLPSSMDDDGGGSESNWGGGDLERPKIAKDLWDDDLYTNVPVGIREFMKHEKKLKKKHEQEGTSGG